MSAAVGRVFSAHRKGVQSFDYSKKHKMIGSSGLEREVLLWDPYICLSALCRNSTCSVLAD